MQSEDRPPDDVVIHQLGAAVLLCWHRLPLTARNQILAQAEDMIGIAPLPSVRDKITRLVLRRSPRK